jgi:hypothetical protein
MTGLEKPALAVQGKAGAPTGNFFDQFNTPPQQAEMGVCGVLECPGRLGQRPRKRLIVSFNVRFLSGAEIK